MHFQPSAYSAIPAGAARQNYSAYNRTTVDVSTLGISAIARGLSNVALSKSEQYVKAVKLVEKYKLAYRKCKAQREAKGEKAFPHDNRTGLFVRNCHNEYEKWMKWEKKAGESAGKLKSKLKGKGLLDQNTAQDLDIVVARPAIAVQEQRTRDVQQRKQQLKKKQMSDQQAELQAQAELAAVDYASPPDYTIPAIVGVGVLLSIGGGVWWYTRKA